ncbi:hypothetical protein [Moraxella caprae]|nr:hypothetical protein [Moraxella caprae]
MSQELTHKLLTKNPYFNASGLTSSEANYICESIKETLNQFKMRLPT